MLYEVITNTIITCSIRGRMRLEDSKSTNPVAVGDTVKFSLDIEEGVIAEVDERKNYIVRRASNLSKESHVLAANVDQAVLIVTINYPITSRVFVDRFIAASEAYRIPVQLIFNKLDRYDAKHLAMLDEWRQLYENIGYPTMAVSAHNLDNQTEVKELLKDIV